MNKKFIRLYIIISYVCLISYGLCSDSFAAGADARKKITVFVSIAPQAYFVKRIAGSYVKTEILVGAGQSPETYEPTPKQMISLRSAPIYFRIGVPFENGFIDKIAAAYKNLKIIDTRNGVKLRYFGNSKDNEAYDPHIWLDPNRVKIQAETICEALSEIAPDHISEFERNLHAFKKDLDRINIKIADMLAHLKGSKFYVFHPAFGYFGDAYGLTQEAVETEGKEPSPKRLSNLIANAKSEGVKAIFVQPQFDKKNAETIAKEIGAAVIPIDPLAYDYLDNLEKIADAIKTAFK